MDTQQLISLLVSIHKDQVSLVNTLWAIYQGISLAALGYVFSQEFVRKNPLILACLSMGFLIFAFANQQAILRSQELIYTTAVQLKILAIDVRLPEAARIVLNAYEAVSPSTLQVAHLTFSFLVVVGIWAPFLATHFTRTRQKTSIL